MIKIAVIGSFHESLANALPLPRYNKVSTYESSKKDVTE